MRLKIDLGKTVNMGNFESLRVDVGAEWDVIADPMSEAVDRSLIEMEVKVNKFLLGSIHRMKASHTPDPKSVPGTRRGS